MSIDKSGECCVGSELTVERRLGCVERDDAEALLSFFALVTFLGFFDFSDASVLAGLNGCPCRRRCFQCHT